MRIELSDRLTRLKSNVGISDVCPSVKSNGASECPICGQLTFSTWENRACKCWRPSCSLNKSRDVIGLFQELNRLSFIAAVEALEKRAGLSNFSSGHLDQRSELLQQCLNIYVEELWGKKGQAARDYLYSRGFSKEYLERTEIGFAPNGSTLRGYDLDLNLLRKEGLLKGRSEYFSNRIIFPIRDYYGRLVQFQGRHLGEVPKDDEGNDMVLRWKDGQEVPGIGGLKSYLFLEHKLKDYSKNGTLILTEGAPDTMTLDQLGLPAAGILGLEKIMSHIHKFKDFQELIWIFDNDIYPVDHKECPLEYKSWRRIIPQIINLQFQLPHISHYIWMVPDQNISVTGYRFNAKDVNEWFVKSGADRSNFWGLVQEGKQELIAALINQWGSDLSKHGVLLKLMSSTGRTSKDLLSYIPPELDPVQYAMEVIGR